MHVPSMHTSSLNFLTSARITRLTSQVFGNKSHIVVLKLAKILVDCGLLHMTVLSSLSQRVRIITSAEKMCARWIVRVFKAGAWDSNKA